MSIDAVKEFVSAANKLNCECDVKSGRYIVDAKSLMGIFSIDLSEPLEITLRGGNPENEPFWDEFMDCASKYSAD